MARAAVVFGSLTSVHMLAVGSASSNGRQLTYKTLSQRTVKAKIHYTSFPAASLQQVRNKLARAKVRCVCCVVSFPEIPLQRLVANLSIVANKSVARLQLPRLRGSCGETCVLWILGIKDIERAVGAELSLNLIVSVELTLF